MLMQVAVRYLLAGSLLALTSGAMAADNRLGSYEGPTYNQNTGAKIVNNKLVIAEIVGGQVSGTFGWDDAPSVNTKAATYKFKGTETPGGFFWTWKNGEYKFEFAFESDGSLCGQRYHEGNERGRLELRKVAQ